MSQSILIIDDDAAFCRVLTRGLERRGFQVASALNIEQALREFTQLKPDGVVLDLRLGEESGLSIIAELKQLHPQSHILLLTGYASIPSAVEAVKRGAINYLPKPATVDDIVQALSLGNTPHLSPATENPAEPSVLSVRRLEWEHIQRVLNENNGNVSETARQLGMHRRSLQRKLAKRPVLK